MTRRARAHIASIAWPAAVAPYGFARARIQRARVSSHGFTPTKLDRRQCIVVRCYIRALRRVAICRDIHMGVRVFVVHHHTFTHTPVVCIIICTTHPHPRCMTCHPPRETIPRRNRDGRKCPGRLYSEENERNTRARPKRTKYFSIKPYPLHMIG